jgi:RNA-binding protein YlmH
LKAYNLDNLPVGVDAHLVARILESCETVRDKQEVKFTEFLDPFHREFIRPLVGNFFGIRHLEDGGYSDAEKQRLAIFPDYYSPGDIEMPIAAVEVRLSDPTRLLSHRDYLGAVAALGIKVSYIGDILVFSGGAYVIAAREVVNLICTMDEVNRFRAEVVEIPPYNLCGEEQPARIIRCTVASLRLDAVVSAGLGMGRGKAADLIKGDKVKVNWRQIVQPGFQLKEGDIISIRGRGRLELSVAGGETKKGRIRVEVKKFS